MTVGTQGDFLKIIFYLFGTSSNTSSFAGGGGGLLFDERTMMMLLQYIGESFDFKY